MSTPGSYGAHPTQPGRYPGDGYPAAGRGYLEGGPVGFGDAIKQAFSNGFVYRGRASRSAYWWFVLFDFIAVVVLELVLFGLAAALKSAAALFFVIFGIAIIYLALVGLSLTIRRLHDIDRTGWWVLIGLVPFGGIVLLVFSLLEGTPGPNRYQP